MVAGPLNRHTTIRLFRVPPPHHRPLLQSPPHPESGAITRNVIGNQMSRELTKLLRICETKIIIIRHTRKF